MSNGDLYTWGYPKQSGPGINSKSIKVPTKVSGISGVVSISSTYSDYAAITVNGDLYTGGFNSYGHLGISGIPVLDPLWDPSNDLQTPGYETTNDFIETYIKTPTKVQGLSNVAAVSIGDWTMAAITVDGELYTCGKNDVGQLGLGDNINRAIPTKVPGLQNVVGVCAGEYSTIAITASGDLYIWGQHYDGVNYMSNTPKKIDDLSDVVAVCSAYTHFAAITSNGDLYTMGGNSYGELGLGDTRERNIPTKVPYLSNVVSVSLGHFTSSAITANGDLYTWGYDKVELIRREVVGMLGHGPITDSYISIPTKIQSISNIVSISMHENSSMMALTENGDLYSWGLNSTGYCSLGLNDTIDRDTPTHVLSGVMVPNTTAFNKQESSFAAKANLTSSNVLVDGQIVAFDAYTINDNNYFKLRDLAYVLNGSDKQFDVGWDEANNTILLTSGKAYDIIGGEMISKGNSANEAVPTKSRVILNGQDVLFTAFNIDGNNYFKLRDVGEALDFYVQWDDERNTIEINTSQGYSFE